MTSEHAWETVETIDRSTVQGEYSMTQSTLGKQMKLLTSQQFKGNTL